MLNTKVAFAAAAIAGFAVSPALAQSAGQARLFARGNFAGSAVTLSGPQRGIGPLTVKSVEIPAGAAWELCTGATFTGCKQFTASDRAMVMTVRSARPLAAVIPASASAALPAGTVALAATGGSLRGLASEFFVTPSQGGSRIEVEAGGLIRRAGEFCRSAGWRGSVHAREQSIGGRSYLADVLCTDAD